MPFPNEDTQFKPGQSGNPNGRPNGARSLSTTLREMLEEEIEVTVGGKKEKKRFADVMIRKLLQKANEGDLRAIQEIFDRVEGKALQEIKNENYNMEVIPSPEEAAKIKEMLDKNI